MQPQQQLVQIEAREQALPFKTEALPIRFDVRQPPELAAPDPRQPERHEGLQQRALPRSRAARAASDETHAAVSSRHALEQLARVAVGSLMQHEAVLEQYLFALGQSDLEPEPLQLALAVGPVLADLHPELEVHALAGAARAAPAARACRLA